MKRFDRAIIGHLSPEQMQAILDAGDGATRAGQRDQLLLLLLYNTGARVSEIVALKVQDVDLDSSAAVHIHGKGRKQRSVPLWQETVQLLRSWLRRGGITADSPLLPNAHGDTMSRSGVAQRLRLAVARAAAKQPSLRSVRVSPHTIRHYSGLQTMPGESKMRGPAGCFSMVHGTSTECVARHSPPQGYSALRKASNSSSAL
jgi:site-specific recombinase XerD